MELALDNRLTLVFAALADNSRRALLARLAEQPASISSLSEGLPFTRQATTKHLRSLLDAGLVFARKKGREQVFELTPDPLAEAEAWIAGLEKDWQKRLLALKAAVEGER